MKIINNKLTTKKLYRATCSAEANDFLLTGRLSTSFGQMEKKFFATTLADAEKWGLKLGSSNIISVCVPKSALKHYSIFYFSWLGNIGPAYYFSDISYLNKILR